MKNKVHKIAKTLFKFSLTNGFIDDSLVRQVLTSLEIERPQHLAKILKNYKRLIFQKLNLETVRIEVPQLSEVDLNLSKSILKKTNAKKLQLHQNPKIIGAKITHGDWIWEDTLDAKLTQLSTNYEL